MIRKHTHVYDPLQERITLIRNLCEEYETWSRHARGEGKSDAYVAKILALLKATLKDTEGLLERLNLLAPREASPEVFIDISLIQHQVTKPDEFAEFVSKMSQKLSEIAVPTSIEYADELQSEEGRTGTNPPIDVGILQTGGVEQAGDEDPGIVLESDSS